MSFVRRSSPAVLRSRSHPSLSRAAARVIESLEPRRLLAAAYWPVEGEFGLTTAPAASPAPGSPDGSFVVAWSGSGDGDTDGVFARRIDATGKPIGENFRVNTYTTNSQSGGSIAYDPTGGFAVTWTSTGQDGSGDGVYAQQYDAAGLPRGGEFRVAETTAGRQYSGAPAFDADGSLVIAWTGAGIGDSDGVFFRRFDQTGNPLGAETRINAASPGIQQSLTIARVPSGGILFAWEELPQQGGFYSIRVSRLAADGTLGNEFVASSVNQSFQSHARLAVMTNGDFVVAWSAVRLVDWDVQAFARRFRADGTPLSDDFVLNHHVPGSQYVADLEPTADGGFVASWDSSEQDGSARGVYARSFDATGQADAPEFRLSTTSAGDQHSPRLRVLSGGLLAMWSGVGVEGYRLHAQRYRLIDPASAGGLGDRVWHDANGDGIQGVTEPGVPGVLVESIAASGAPGPAAVTDAAGRFGVLVPGGETASLRVIPPLASPFTLQGIGSDRSRDSDVDPATGLAPPVLVVAGDMNGDVDAGLQWRSTVSGAFFNDRNGSGTPDAGEEQLPGMQVYADLDRNGRPDPGEPLGTTDGAGLFTLIGVPDGVQTLRMMDQDRWSEFETLVTVPLGQPVDGVFVRGSTSEPDSVHATRGTVITAGTHIPGGRAEPGMAMRGDGSFVLVWTAPASTSAGRDPSEYGVYALRYAANGTPIGSEFRVNTTTAGTQRSPVIAMDESGGFVIAWQSDGQDGSEWGVYAQRYDANATPIGGEFRVNTTTAGAQARPAIAMSDAGEFVIVWTEPLAGGRPGVYARLFAADGTPRGEEFLVATLAADRTGVTSAAAMDRAGRFVVTWPDRSSDGSSRFRVLARGFDASGLPRSSAFQVNEVDSVGAANPAIAMDASGAFAIAWETRSSETAHTNVVRMQRFNGDLLRQGGEVMLRATAAPFTQSRPSLAMDDAGGLVATWLDNGAFSGGRTNLVLRRFNAAGVPQGAMTRLYEQSSTVAGAIGMAGNGRFAVAWPASPDVVSTWVRVQRFEVGSGPIHYAVGDRVWRDADDDGIQDAGETGVPGVNVEGLDADGNVIARAVTDADGIYQLFLPAGASARVRFVLPDRMFFSRKTTPFDRGIDSDADPLTGITDSFVVGDDNRTIDAGLVPASRVTGVAYHDRNGNGVRDAGEEPIAGLRVFVDLDEDRVLDAGEPVASTSASGEYVFDSLRSGRFSVHVAPDHRWERLPVNSSGSVSIGGTAAYSIAVRSRLATTIATPAGATQQVNTQTASTQSDVAMAADAQGNYVIAWTSLGRDGDGSSIVARRFAADGTPLGDDFLVNQFSAGNQSGPAIGVEAGGAFVIAWTSSGQDGSGTGVYARHYSFGGIPLGNEFRVNTHTAGDQYDPAVAVDRDGNFAIAWTSNDQDGSAEGIYLQRFRFTAAPTGGETRVNSTTTGSQRNPAIAGDGAGNLVVAWETGTDVIFRRVPLVGEMPYESWAGDLSQRNQQSPALAMLPGGLVWLAWAARPSSTLAAQIHLERRPPSGLESSPDLVIHHGGTLLQDHPAIAVDAAGNILVAWTSLTADGVTQVLAQRVTAAGTREGPTLTIAADTANSFARPSVLTSGSSMRLAWSGGNDGSDSGVWSRRYALAAASPLVATSVRFDRGSGAIEFTFDRPIVSPLPASLLQLIDTTTGQPFVGDVAVSQPTDRSVRFNLPTNLPDGLYRATLPAGSVVDRDQVANTSDAAVGFRFLRGDMNDDGVVNNQDIAAFVTALTDPVAFASQFGYAPTLVGDVNRDGTLNNQDLAPFIALLTGSSPASSRPALSARPAPTPLATSASRLARPLSLASDDEPPATLAVVRRPATAVFAS
jgi:hypothetical protein